MRLADQKLLAARRLALPHVVPRAAALWRRKDEGIEEKGTLTQIRSSSAPLNMTIVIVIVQRSALFECSALSLRLLCDLARREYFPAAAVRVEPDANEAARSDSGIPMRLRGRMAASSSWTVKRNGRAKRVIPANSDWARAGTFRTCLQLRLGNGVRSSGRRGVRILVVGAKICTCF